MGKIRILVIDDEELIRETMHYTLEILNYESITAENGEEGLELYKEKSPDLILVDIHMPKMDGIEFIKEIRKTDQETPIIVISGNDLIEEALEAIRAGAWDYINKPITDVNVLNFSITRSLEKGKLLAENKTYRDNLEKANEELMRNIKIIEKDEEAGRQIQFKMLPENDKVINNFKLSYNLFPSQYVSGDFLNYFRIDDTHIGFYFSDISGHGVPSAFITIVLKNKINNFLEEYIKEGDDTIFHPAKLLKRLNDEILAENIEKFLTIFYGIIDLEKEEIIASNGGQFPFPIIIKNGKTTFPDLKSFPVGILKSVDFEIYTIKFYDFDKIFFLSDGIYDIMDFSELEDKNKFILSICSLSNFSKETFITQMGILEKDKIPDDITMFLIEKVKL